MSILSSNIRHELLGPGDTVGWGRYRILRLLGHGGLASVYQAFDSVRGHNVALKLLIPRYVARPERAERLLREEQYLRRLQGNPSFVKVFDHANHEDGRLYFTMEFVEGSTLDELICKHRGWSAEYTCRVARSIAVALQAMHHQGLVHRDVKPDNIIVHNEYEGVVKLIDLGMVGEVPAGEVMAGQVAAGKVAAGQVAAGQVTTDKVTTSEATSAQSSPSDTRRRLTTERDLIGTPGYVAPEQVHRNTPDWSMDIFSLGVVMFEMLTGHSPYGAMSARAYIEMQIRGDRENRSLRNVTHADRIPVSLIKLVDACRAQRPQDRPARMEEVIKQLDAILVEFDPGRARPGNISYLKSGSQQWKPWFHVAAVAAVLFLVLGGLSFFYFSYNNDKGPTIVELVPAPADLGQTQDDESAPAVTTARPSDASEDTTDPPNQDPQPQASDSEGSDSEPTLGSDSEPTPPATRRSKVTTSPHKQLQCDPLKRSAMDAFSRGRWNTVLELTEDPTCWPQPEVRATMRVRSLFQLRQWGACLEAGLEVSNDRETIDMVSFCRELHQRKR